MGAAANKGLNPNPRPTPAVAEELKSYNKPSTTSAARSRKRTNSDGDVVAFKLDDDSISASRESEKDLTTSKLSNGQTNLSITNTSIEAEDSVMDNIDESLEQIRENVLKLMSSHDEIHRLHTLGDTDELHHITNHDDLQIEEIKSPKTKDSVVETLRVGTAQSLQSNLNSNTIPSTANEEDETTSLLSYGDDDATAVVDEDEKTGLSFIQSDPIDAPLEFNYDKFEVNHLVQNSMELLNELNNLVSSPMSESHSSLNLLEQHEEHKNMLGLQRQKIWSYAHNAQLEREVETLQRHLAEMDKVMKGSNGSRESPKRKTDENRETINNSLRKIKAASKYYHTHHNEDTDSVSTKQSRRQRMSYVAQQPSSYHQSLKQQQQPSHSSSGYGKQSTIEEKADSDEYDSDNTINSISSQLSNYNNTFGTGNSGTGTAGGSGFQYSNGNGVANLAGSGGYHPSRSAKAQSSSALIDSATGHHSEVSRTMLERAGLDIVKADKYHHFADGGNVSSDISENEDNNANANPQPYHSKSSRSSFMNKNYDHSKGILQRLNNRNRPKETDAAVSEEDSVANSHSAAEYLASNKPLSIIAEYDTSETLVSPRPHGHYPPIVRGGHNKKLNRVKQPPRGQQPSSSSTQPSKQSPSWSMELENLWHEVKFLLRRSIDSEGDMQFAIASTDAGILYIEQLNSVAKSLHVLRGTISRWILPFDNNTRLDGQCSTPHSVAENMPSSLRGKISERQIHYLVSGANSVRQLVRIKIADDNDLEQARQALLKSTEFFRRLQDEATASSLTQYQLLKQIQDSN